MPVSLLDFFILPVLRCFCGAVLFRSLCPSPNSSYPFWLLALTFRSSRPAFCGRLTSPVSTTEKPLYSSSPCLFKRHLFSQALCGAWFVVSLGFACWLFVSFWSFWPPALVQQAQAAIVFAFLRRLRGAVLFRSLRPSSSWGFPCWLLGLTVQSSRPAFGGRLTFVR